MRLTAAQQRYRRLLNQARGLEQLLSRLEAQGDFDAHAKTIRELATYIYETMSFVLRESKGDK